MTATLIPTTTEAEWLAARKQGITASEIAVLMGLSPYSSPYELYHRKLGLLPEQPDNAAMALGRHMERWVADQYWARNPDLALMGSGRELWQHPERPWQMATPDRLVCEYVGDDPSRNTSYGELLAVLECKVDNGDGFGEDGSDDIPVHYRCQLLWQMDVLGVTTGYLACLIWHRRQLRVYELTLDGDAAADLSLMRFEALRFLDRIRDSNPPDVDWRPATSDALKRLHPDVEERDAHIGRQLEISYRAACRRYKEAERRKEEMTNRLREAMGSAHRAVAARTFGPDGDRVVIARRDVYDVKEHTRRASHVDKLVPVKPKEKP